MHVPAADLLFQGNLNGHPPVVPFYGQTPGQVTLDRAPPDDPVPQFRAGKTDVQFVSVHIDIVPGSFCQIDDKTQHVILVYAPVDISDSRCRRSS